MKKKILLVMIILLACVGCYRSKPEDVKLYDEKQVQKIVDEDYGKANFVSEDKDEELHRITYTFEDDEYKFNYIYVCSANAAKLDGSAILGYEQVTSSSFYGEYKNYILTTLDEDIVSVHSKWGGIVKKNIESLSNEILLINTDTSNLDDIKKDVRGLLDKIEEIDKRKLLDKYYIKIVNKDNEKEQYKVYIAY